ncbi:legume lectin beta domain protein [Medicago truncatula]|uniref:Legume lectin beta domain protein n=1 Tax=Medicago truncatula TaxID=3880 RepID=A0A072TZZ0_MEDTR|nr:legume lectin beta domain protein [Medicago truncatula]
MELFLLFHLQKGYQIHYNINTLVSNNSNNGNSSSHVFGIELDTDQNFEFDEINDNHIGIDINDLKSANSTPAGYYDDYGFRNLSLSSGYAGLIVASHYILGWSFKVNSQAQNLEISELPEPRIFAPELRLYIISNGRCLLRFLKIGNMNMALIDLSSKIYTLLQRVSWKRGYWKLVDLVEF